MERNEFAATVALMPAHQVRGSSRRTVNFVASMREANAAVRPTRVGDLSLTGCSLIMTDAPPIGSEVWIKLSGRLPLRAAVKWVEAGRAGCEFLTPLDDRELEELAMPTGVRKRLFAPPRFPAP
jgi:hypothetical protein